MPKDRPRGNVSRRIAAAAASIAPYQRFNRKTLKRIGSAAVARGGMHEAWAAAKAKSGHSALRLNASEYLPYNERFPALPAKKKGSKPLKKGEIWPESNNYKPGRGSSALKGGTRRRR